MLQSMGGGSGVGAGAHKKIFNRFNIAPSRIYILDEY